MSKEGKIGCLAAINLWAFAGFILVPMFVEVLDRSLFLKLLATPHLIILPWGPPLLLMALFAVLGSSPRPAKRFARVAAAFAIYGALFFVMAGYAFAGHFAMAASDWPILFGCLVAAAILGWWGFSPERKTV